MIGTGNRAKAHLLPRVDDAFILQGLPPRATRTGDPLLPLRRRGHAGVGIDQLLLGLLLLNRLAAVIVGFFFVVVAADLGFEAAATADEATQDLGTVDLCKKRV